MSFDLKRERKKLSQKAFAEAKRFGAVMAGKRNAGGFKSNYVAAKMGIHPSHLSMLEKGKRLWQPAYIRAFLEAIGETTINNRKVKSNGSK